MTEFYIPKPRVIENKGSLELKPDGTVELRDWHVDADGEASPQIALIDAIIALLESVRDEPAEYVDLKLGKLN